MSEFWIPIRRKELIDWLTAYYGKSFVHMKKKQLMAIYLNTRSRLGR